MTKAEFLARLREERATWDALLAQMDAEKMTQPSTADAYALKDVIAHVAWYEREMVGLLRARALAGSELWNLSPEERNAAIYAANKERPLPEVRDEADIIHQQLVEELEALPEHALQDPGYFRAMPADWVPWRVIADNSYVHYQQHRPDMKAGLDS